MYEENPRAIDFGSTKREVRVSEDSGYRESTAALGVNCKLLRMLLLHQNQVLLDDIFQEK